jgi:putative transposase
MEVKFASHCSYQIRYHQVFCVKYRKKLLKKEEYRDYLKECIRGICERYWFTIDEIGTDGDHVHIFVWAAPKISPSQIMQTLKSITAKAMFKQFPEIRKILWWGSFRSDWWYVWTVWEWTNEDIVKKYIRNQWDEIEKQQHKEISLFKLT